MTDIFRGEHVIKMPPLRKIDIERVAEAALSWIHAEGVIPQERAPKRGDPSGPAGQPGPGVGGG
jgi:hypothetical protein